MTKTRTPFLAPLSRLTLGAAGTLAALMLCTGLASAQSRSDVSPNETRSQLEQRVANTFIFRLADATPAADVSRRAEAAARMGGGRVQHVYDAALKGFALRVNARAAANIAARVPGIVGYEPDQIMSIEAYTNTPPAYPGGQTRPWGINRVNAPLCGLANGRVWVIDTGIDLNHSDIKVADASLHFATSYTSVQDGNSHGTHVAGTVAAINNDFGVVGVAPGIPVVGIKVLSDSGSGSNSDVIAGVNYVAKLRKDTCPNSYTTYNSSHAQCSPQAWVANMSLGGGANSTLDSAVLTAARLGVRFAIAAGNSNRAAGNYSPARVNHENIFTVSASDQNDIRASFSNFGNPPVDIAAPGVAILSTTPGNNYASYSGTSMASPHVAGLLTLLPSLKSTSVSSATYLSMAGDTGKGYPDPIARLNTTIPCSP